jgi:hypothetical protein
MLKKGPLSKYRKHEEMKKRQQNKGKKKTCMTKEKKVLKYE